jgi:very-short-patch-repair endonuclease
MGIAPQDNEGGKPFGGGGLGGMGGGFGGGKGGLGGGKTPGGGGAPGLPGDSLAPSMSGGSPAPSGGATAPSGGAPMAAYHTQLKSFEDAKKIAPKVHRPNKYQLKEPKQPDVPEMEMEEGNAEDGFYYGPRDGAVRLTDIEMKLYMKIEQGQLSGNLPLDWVTQQKPEPVHMPRVVVDGFFPSIKLIIEADGKQWHSSDEDIAKDQERDGRLGKLGWTVLRFTEDEIKYSADDVLAVIIEKVKEMAESQQTPEMQQAAENNINMKKHSSFEIAEVISEDLSEYNAENEEEMEKIIKEKEELSDLLPE